MAPRMVLHIGAMKSGTSYFQSLLYTNRDLLAERGICVPGTTWQHQFRAVQDVLGHAVPDPGRTAGAWQAVVDEVHRHDGTSVLSMEYLGPAVPEKIDRVLAALPDVTAVVSARDLNRTLAAMWQETVQNGRSWSMGEYVAGAAAWRPHTDRRREHRTESGRTFWRQQNLVRLCRNWQRAGARVVLVTVPPPGAPHEVLRDRFLEVLGTTARGLVAPTFANESIGAASATVLRRLNQLLDAEGLEFPAGRHVRKSVLAKDLLAARRASEPRVGLPLTPWVTEQAATTVAKLQALDVDLVGEWRDLVPADVPGVDPDEVDCAEALEAALTGLGGVLAREIRRG